MSTTDPKPDAHLSGRTALVTGAASGLGLCTAHGLARRGAHVLMLDRNVAGGEEAVRRVCAAVPGAKVEFRALDLGNLAAIRTLAAALLAEFGALDILVNNAGLLPPLRRATTVDGFELGFGVSVIGHYALTGLLLPLLLGSAAPRVVSVSSIVHGNGRIDFDDLQMAHRYEPNRAYASAKLGSLLFALELQRRASQAGTPLLSVAAHPGISRTSIGDSWKSKPPEGVRDLLARAAMAFAMRWMGQSAEQGAQPLLYAAAQPGLSGGTFYGPGGPLQFRGPPRRVEPKPRAQDPQQAARLWEALERLTGIRYAWPSAA